MNTVFLLYEVATVGRVEHTLIDIFSDWKEAEDARVGLNSQREHGFIEYTLVEWAVR